MSALSSPVVPRDKRKLVPLGIAGGAVAAVALPLVFLNHSHSTPPAPAATPAPKVAPAPVPGAPATAAPRAQRAPSVHATKTSHGGALSDPFSRGLSKSAAATTPSTTTSPSKSSLAVNNAPGSPLPGGYNLPSSSHASPTSPTSTPSVTSPSTPTVTGTTTTPPVSTTAPAATPHPAAVRPRTFRADVRFTPANGTGLHRRLVRFTALPSVSTPFAVYLGAVRGGRAAFLLNHVATASGPARCARFSGAYQTLFLKPGQTEHVSVPWFGSALTFDLGLVHLRKHDAASAHTARVANHRVAPGGRRLLVQHHLLGKVHFSTVQGLLAAPKKTHLCG